MCGIVGVVQGEDSWNAIPLEFLSPPFEAASLSMPDDLADPALIDRLNETAREIGKGGARLRGVRGIITLAQQPNLIDGFERLLDELWSKADSIESVLDDGAKPPAATDIEELNAAIVDVRDGIWRVKHDCLRIANAALDLAGREATPHATGIFGMIAIALSAIDRIEVRGRDSAGIAVVIRGHSLDLAAGTIRAQLAERTSDPVLPSGSIREADGNLCFVYKAAAEVGELGDNTRAIRDAVRSDPLLHMACNAESSRGVVLGHTRWASVGMISEANAHPVSSDELEAGTEPAVFAVLNGDIDNHADILSAEGLEFPREITTDTKLIGVLVARKMREGLSLEEAFRQTVVRFEGSVAIGAVCLEEPDKLLLALRGSGQALYIGLSEGGYLVASEPYGFVEQAGVYVRMDGEVLHGEDDTRGEIVVLSEPAADEPTEWSGIARVSYDGTPVPVKDDLAGAEITTRDVDRGPYPHFLLKEMLESPRSFRKTLRGRLVEDDGELCVLIGADTIPADLDAKLRDGSIKRIVVIGQGSAAIAGTALGRALSVLLASTTVAVDAVAATELSGFGLRDDMSDTLVIPISQSGTTADTNRTVEVARARGAWIVSIVNRRGSDLTDRSHGVLYTSDGRDVEMAVPSTKAFYAQVAAGFLLSAALAERVPGATPVEAALLEALRALPQAMEEVLAQRPQIAEIAQRHVPMRRDWAVVGNGWNRIAAEEVRIKLSELCYKSISSDVTEDKKHIDLSAEPLILVCAAGLIGSNAEDASKEVVYYRAHKAAPIVIAGEGEGRYEAALDVIRVPSVHPDVAFVLSTMAGHVFGYEAALAIDALARPLREARTLIEVSTEAPLNGADPFRLLERIRATLGPVGVRFREGLRGGSYDGHLEPSTAVKIASLFRYATGMTPLDAYQIEYGKVGTPTEVLRDLLSALTVGIDKLTRPIDAIRHQAKTVTVGISRAEETLLQAGLVREVLDAGVARDRLTYGTLRALAALDPAIEAVAGYTLYRVEGDVRGDDAMIHITDRGGIARDIPSRTDRDPRLRGTKHRVADERAVLVTRGHDGRTLVIVPEVKGAEVTGIALLHVRFHDQLAADVMRGVLQGYRDRYAALRDMVTETEPTFRDDLLAEIDVTDLLIESIQVLAREWRT